jgi:hypothetical protein
MDVEVGSGRTNRVGGDAQVDGLGLIQRADGDRRRADHAHEKVRWFSEQRDRGDVVGHVGRHGVRYTVGCSIRYDTVGDEAHHGCTLRVSAEHHLCVRTARRRGPDVSGRVFDAVYRGGEVGGGGVVDRIYLDRLCAGSRAQRVHECLSGGTNTGCLGGAAGEYHLDVGARLRGRGRYRRAQLRPTRCRSSTNEPRNIARSHCAMLTHRGGDGDLRINGN